MRISDWSSDVCSSDLNFWRDKTAVRGIWRRTTPESYRSAQPAWETVLDLDALADSENENWVWHGAQCLRPDYTRCLIALSRRGADAAVSREFALDTRSFALGRASCWERVGKYV